MRVTDEVGKANKMRVNNALYIFDSKKNVLQAREECGKFLVSFIVRAM